MERSSSSPTASMMSDNPLAMSRGERGRKFGIDCVNILSWSAGTWEPGGEYVKKLIVKNVSTQTVKIKYQIPATKFFSMEFPKMMILSPGMFVAVDVLFRPIHYEAYDDTIIFKTVAGEFGVRVQSFVSTLKVTVPPTLDLGFCPTGEITTRTIKVRNVGQQTATFSWKHGPPFTLRPLTGTVEPGKSSNIEVSFDPKDASVFVASAVCTVPGHDPLLMKMSGIGKYPFISSSDKSLDFEEVLTDIPSKMIQKEFELRNQSLVRATFKIVAVEHDHDPVFRFSPTTGVIDPESHIMVRVQYYPKAARTFTCDNFDIITPGGNTVRINCRALGIGPTVVLAKKENPREVEEEEDGEDGQASGGGSGGGSNGMVTKRRRPVDRPTSLSFGDVKIGSVVSRVVYLNNNSSIPVYYQFVVEDKGTFQFNQTYGIIPPNLQSHVVIRFDPEVSGNFCRRIFCLLKDQMPVAIDCVGTAYYDLSKRPAPLTLRQLDAHRRRQNEGLGVLSPAELVQMLNRGKREDLFDLHAVNPSSCGGSFTRLTRSGEATEVVITPMHTFFKPQCGVGEEITMDQTSLDFGGCSRHRPADKKRITVRNNTHGKVTCMWRIPLSDDDDDELDFEVIPSSADISPGETYTFRVVFRPSQDDFYYNQEIEAFVYFKANRNFRLVNEDTLVPPWCLTCRVYGHTFGSTSEQFIPTMKCSAVDDLVCFPPCHLGDSVYQTIKIENKGDTPTEYRFEEDPTNTFEAKPRLGVVEAGGFTLVALKYTPNEIGWTTTTLRCPYNNSALECLELKLSGQAYLPALTIENTSLSGGLFFKPTSTGIVSERVLHLRNVARVPVVFRWEIPRELAKYVKVEPKAGRLLGNEVLATKWTFAPKAQREYKGRATLVLRSLGGMNSAKQAKRVSLPIEGVGSSGAVQFSPPELDVGTTLVGAETTKILTLMNTSDCDLYYRVDSIRSSDLALIDQDGDGDVDIEEVRAYAHMRKALADDGDGEVTEEELAELESAGIIGFDPVSGLLPARSSAPLKVTYRPTLPETNSFRVFCDVVVAEKGKSQEDIDWDKAAAEREEEDDGPLFCDVEGRAAYPTMKICDARSALLSPDELWRHFNLRALNYELSTPLSPAQLRLNRATGVGDGADEFANLLKDFDFRFTPRPQGSPNEVVLFQIENVSNLPLRFEIKFPNELDIELEQWADVGEPTELEIRQNSIIDQRLFEFEPRKGDLGPGESMILRLSYSYNCLDFGGDHIVPITMKLDKGKQLRLWMRGRTLPRGFAKMFTPSTITTLKPTRIGHEAPPTQSINLRNPSDVDVEYRIDVSPLLALNDMNYQFPIMTISDEKLVDENGFIEGFIASGSWISIPITFQPLEVKQYSVELNIQYRGSNGEPCAITTASSTGSGAGSGPSSAEVAVEVLRLEGRGYDPTPVDEEEEAEDEHGHLSAEERLAMAAANLANRPKADEVAYVETDEFRCEAKEFGLPNVQTLLWPGVLASLSVDSVEFSEVPSGACVYRTTTIRNQTMTGDSLEFEWDHEHPLIASGILKIYPSHGKIDPNKLVVCKMTLRPGFDPEIIDTDVSCRVALLTGDQDQGRRGKRSRRGSTSGSRRGGGSVGGGSIVSTAPSQGGRAPTSSTTHTSVVRRTTAASRGGRPEQRGPPSNLGGSTVGSTQGGGGGRMGTSHSTMSNGGGGSGDNPGTGMMIGPSMLLFAHVTADVMRPDVYRSFHQEERGAMGKFYIPKREVSGANGGFASMLSGVDNPEEVDGGSSNSSSSSSSSAAASIKTLAQEVMESLVDDLMDDPFVKHLVEDMAPSKTPFFVKLNEMESIKAGRRGVAEEEEKKETSKSEDDALEQTTRGPMRPTDQSKLLQSSETQDLLSRIMENTFFNLISEVAHGEINLNVEPRRMVVASTEEETE